MVSCPGIPNAVISDLVTAVVALTCPVPSTVILYKPDDLAVYPGWVYLVSVRISWDQFPQVKNLHTLH